MDKKKKGILLLSVSGLLLVGGFFVWSVGRMKKTEQQKTEEQAVESVVIDTPEGESVPIAESKTDAYEFSNKKNIEDYWDEMASEEDEDLYESSAQGGTAPGAKKMRKGKASVDDFFPEEEAEQTGQAAAQPASRAYSREDRMNDYQAQRQQIVQDVLAQQALANGQQVPVEPATVKVQTEDTVAVEPKEELEKIDVDRVMVRKSGSVSSLDDGGVSSLGGTGISSLDGNVTGMYVDDDYPFKCMFVRQEKIKSGQRVTVRLLEDMVVQGTLVPKNTHLTAIASISGRLDLNVTNIEMGGHIYNLDYDAYDNDGTKGIYCPDISQEMQSAKRKTKSEGTTQLRRANSKLGGITQDIMNFGTSLVESSLNASGEMTVTVPEGYTFFIVKSRRKKSTQN